MKMKDTNSFINSFILLGSESSLSSSQCFHIMSLRGRLKFIPATISQFRLSQCWRHLPLLAASLTSQTCKSHSWPYPIFPIVFSTCETHSLAVPLTIGPALG